MSLNEVLSTIDSDLDGSLARLMELLRIPSISTDPAYADDCERAADWLVEDLKSLGAEATKHATPGRPMVVGHVGEGAPHLLFYGHYDVQPVDPLELWDREPFDPEIQETPAGRVIRGRGSSDDKGQLMTFVEACRAWKAVHGALPCRITFLFEGEEESGSPSLVPFLKAHAEELKADIALICDTGLFDPETPGITTMLRGMLQEEVIVTGPNKDLHSGMYGGAARNPIRVLSKIIASLHDETGRVTVPGFYDGVDEISDALRAQWEALGFDAEGFLGDVGLSLPAGEERAHGSGAGLGQADLRGERDPGGLCRGRVQDGAAVGGTREDQFPAGGAAGPPEASGELPGDGARGAAGGLHGGVRGIRRRAGFGDGDNGPGLRKGAGRSDG